MKTWESLLEQSILGLQGNVTQIVADNDKLASLLTTALQTENNERGFLRCIALVNAYRKAGEKKCELPKVETLNIANDETLAECSDAASLRLRSFLMDNRELLTQQWCHYAEITQQRVSYSLLPLLLQAGRNSRQLRPVIVKVIGERGLWLAQFNSDWSYATRSSQQANTDDWQLLPDQERCLYLSELRQKTPDIAREQLSGFWKQQSAKQRLELLQSFVINLNKADIEFLESLVNTDRSKGVRKLAAELLMRLSDSAITQKMRQQASAFIIKSPKKGLLGKVKIELKLQFPEAYLEDWESLGIEREPPSYGKKIGQKAGWLEQLLVWIPPNDWCQQFGLSATQLIDLAKHSDWTELLMTVWHQASVIHQDHEFAEALFKQHQLFSGQKDSHYYLAEMVLHSLPISQRQQLIAELLPKLNRWEYYTILSKLNIDWDEPLSLQFIQQLFTKPPTKKNASYYYGTRQSLDLLALKIDPSCFEKITAKYSKLLKELSDDEPLESFYQTYQLRHQMQQELTP